jgi:hypothetical protein
MSHSGLDFQDSSARLPAAARSPALLSADSDSALCQLIQLCQCGACNVPTDTCQLRDPQRCRDHAARGRIRTGGATSLGCLRIATG